jgi:hypothetical protein
VSHPELDPVDERVAPIVLALGRTVLGASALEKLLLVELTQRRAKSGGLTEELSRQIAELERRPAGELLRALRELGIEQELATRIAGVIERRNRLVHGAIADPIIARPFATGEGVDEAVDYIDALGADIQAIINEIGPGAFSGAEAALGHSMRELLEAAKAIDLDQIEDPGLRGELDWIRRVAAPALESDL